MSQINCRWYLVFTKPRQENTAKENLERQGFRTYFPLKHSTVRKHRTYQLLTEPMFPRYIFLQSNNDEASLSSIRSTRGCITLVRFGQNPALIPTPLIDSLRQVEAHQFSKTLGKKSHFDIGDHILIVEGLLTGYEGIIESTTSSERISVLLNIAEKFSRSVKVSLHDVIRI